MEVGGRFGIAWGGALKEWKGPWMGSLPGFLVTIVVSGRAGSLYLSW